MSRLQPLAIRHVWVCTSPKAGSGRYRDELRHLEQRLRERSIQCHVTTDIAALQRESTAQSLATGDVAVVAAGGDGTVSLVADHVRQGVPIVPMPMGTENLLARHFGFSPWADDVVTTITAGQTFCIDAGRANGRLFLVMVSAGFDAEVVRGMHLTRRGHIRKWHYAAPFWRAMCRYRFRQIDATSDVDAASSPETDRGCWMMAFNLPRYAASLGIEPAATFDDGRLNLIRFQNGSLWSSLRYAVAIRSGKHLNHVDVRRAAVTRTIWRSDDRVPYQIDGDYAGRLPVEIICLPQYVTLMRSAPITGTAIAGTC